MKKIKFLHKNERFFFRGVTIYILLFCYKKVTKVKEILRDSVMSPVISLWSKYKSKAFIESNGMRNKATLGPLNWKQKKTFLLQFYHTSPIRCVSRIPLYKFDGFRCLFDVYTLAWCPLGGVTQIVRLHIIFWHTLDVFYREKIIKINDNKTPKAHDKQHLYTISL